MALSLLDLQGNFPSVNNIIYLLSTEPTVFLSFVFIFGLFIGSFLNVVIHRYPVMMKREWREAAIEILQDCQCKVECPPVKEKRYNLVVPRSACPACGHKITALENIPIVSYLFLRGRCSSCGTSISVRYPFVELITGLAFFVVSWLFGFSWITLALLFVTASLIALTFIDIDTTLLPDVMVYPILWLGLLFSLYGLTIPIADAMWGAVAGYLSLWSVYWAFKLATGKEGMGHGDFKLLAALGAWVGWQKLIIIVLMSSLVGAILGILMMTLHNRGRDHKIPFGPYLAIAGWITLLWGDSILSAYITFAGLDV
ncbi:MAG: A24 family peptidase [Pseudomonadota bacterium]